MKGGREDNLKFSHIEMLVPVEPLCENPNKLLAIQLWSTTNGSKTEIYISRS